jgi:hypothetical protein
MVQICGQVSINHVVSPAEAALSSPLEFDALDWIMFCCALFLDYVDCYCGGGGFFLHGCPPKLIESDIELAHIRPSSFLLSFLPSAEHYLRYLSDGGI